MNRVPGHPNAKWALLKGLDKDSLPFLAADILAECFGHKEIQVTDGPGDGRRDIHSVTKAGGRCVSQCKFHSGRGTAVGSRETDELPVAMVKFGAKDGFFFTTGRVSPQARREYLDDFPDVNLRLLDGGDLVDCVLSTPALSEAWISGDVVGSRARRIGILAVARDASTDAPLPIGRMVGDLRDAMLLQVSVPSGVFAPYRAPSRPVLDSGRGDTAWATLVVPELPFSIRSATEAKGILLDSLHAAISDRSAGTTWIVRFGPPVILRNACDDQKDHVYLPGVPESFAITRAAVMAEQQFLVPAPSTGWVFPDNVSVADGDWASWMSDELDVWFRVHVQDLGAVVPFLAEMAAQHRARLDASLFAVGPSDQRASLLTSLGPSLAADFECACGPAGVLLGWFHPDVDSRNYYAPQDVPGPAVLAPRFVPEFDMKVQQVRGGLAPGAFREVRASEAEMIAQLAGAKPLVPFASGHEHYAVELALAYEDVASPVALSERECMFVSWWQVPASLAEAREVVADALRVALPLRPVHHEVRNAPRWKRPVAMITFRVPSPVDQATAVVLAEYAPQVAKSVEVIKSNLQRRVPDARLASRWFWETEVRTEPSITTIYPDGTVRVETFPPTTATESSASIHPVDQWPSRFGLAGPNEPVASNGRE
jgi:hypothetical protein